MNENILARLKSRTHWVNLFMLALGVIEVNMHMVQDLFGKWYGMAFIGVAVIYAVMREITTKPVTEK